MEASNSRGWSHTKEPAVLLPSYVTLSRGTIPAIANPGSPVLRREG